MTNTCFGRTNNAMTYGTTMQLFIEIKKNFEGDKIAFKRSYDKLAKGLFNKFHMK